MEKKLYQWQEECLERWFANNGRGMVQAATGSGKTVLALTAVKRLEKKLEEESKEVPLKGQERQLHIKIVVPTGALMRQWYKALRGYLDNASESRGDAGNFQGVREKIGLRGNGCKDSADCKYMIYVINSARYELARQILAELKDGGKVLLIADECHHYGSGQNRLIFEFLPYIKEYEKNFFSLGLSATLPSGQVRHYLASALGGKIYSYGMDRASTQDTVCPYDIYHIGLAFQEEERQEYEELSARMKHLYSGLLRAHSILGKVEQKERYEILKGLCGSKNKKIAEAAAMYIKLSYKRKSLVCTASARTVCAYDLAERLADEEKILIFGERISQAEELYGLLEERFPGKAGRYHSKMGQMANKNVLERFRDGDIRILIACKAMDEGVDIPDVSAGIVLSGTSAQRQRIQRLGRIVRKKEGKERALLYYLHITETSEDSCFLPEGGENHIFEMEYFPEGRKFVNLPYDKAADKFLREMLREGAAGEKIKEAQRCIRLGCVRPDWRLGREEIAKRIKGAKRISDRNYWVCMKRIGDFATGEGK